ncbi:MAG: sulfotransferase domain-containing protein [Geminicoccaceae bacterium]|nr:sulfotransferase domain-containing protein [Geminicoccaceae bacterium]MDW8123453.1 sulfotransferase domain-containing protein [Geminicoccaceae bacterium]
MSFPSTLLRRIKDEHRRTKKRLPELRAADVVLVSHAKSGRTWLVALISHVLHLTRGVPIDELWEGDNFQKFDPSIPRLYLTHDHNEPWWLRLRLPRLVRDKRLIVLVRDPRDVAVSWYYHNLGRSHARVRWRMGLPEDMSRVDMASFVTHPAYGVPGVVALLERWARIARAHPRALLLRYEDLRARTAEELARVLAFLGLEAPREAIEAAVAFASFDSLREKERTGFYRTEKLQARDPADPRSYKVRRGKVGGYRDELPAEVVARLDRLVAERLDPALGYAARAGSRTAASM